MLSDIVKAIRPVHVILGVVILGIWLKPIWVVLFAGGFAAGWITKVNR
jgi:hypothetical protein